MSPNALYEALPLPAILAALFWVQCKRDIHVPGKRWVLVSLLGTTALNSMVDTYQWWGGENNEHLDQIEDSLDILTPVFWCFYLYSCVQQVIESRLATSEARYRSLVEHSPEAILVLDVGQSRFIEANASALALLKVDRERMLATPLEEFVGPGRQPDGRGSKEAANDHILQALNGGFPCFDWEFRDALGTLHDLEVRLARLPSNSTQLVRASLVDNSARKRLERLRREQSERAGRAAAALVRLATHPAVTQGNLAEVAAAVTETTAQLLQVRLVSVWMLSPDHRELRCVDLFDLASGARSIAPVLPAGEFPRYFASLVTGRCIATSAPAEDPRTSELKDAYLLPLGITAMLDAPIRVGGRMVGVVCFEHIGPYREWQLDEVTFAADVADQVAHALLNQERAAALASARENERFAHGALDALAAQVAVLDARGNIIATNDAWDKLAAAGAPSEPPQTEPVNYLAVCDRAAADGIAAAASIAGGIRRVLSGEVTAFRSEYPLDSPAGEKFFLCRVTRFASPGETRIVVAHEDITPIRAAQKCFEELFESAPDALVMTDGQGQVVLANRRAEQMFGWTAAELIGRSVQTLILPARNHPETPWPTATGTPELRKARVNLVARRKDLTTFPAEVSFSPLQVEGQSRVAAAFRDVSERHAAEQAIRQALATLDAANDAILIFNPATLRITFANAGAVAQMGFTRNELLAMTPLDLVVDLGESDYRNLLAPLMAGTLPKQRLTTRHRRKAASPVPVESHLQCIVPADGAAQIVCVARDISERLNDERMANRSRRLEAIGTLAGGIAHDLNNSLTPVLMALEMLKGQPGADRETLLTMETGARRASLMVKQLLAFAKGTEGKKIPVQMTQLIHDMETIVRATFPKDIKVNVMTEPDLPVVIGDPTLLHQAILNLCVNARDAMPKGGRLTLSLAAHTWDAPPSLVGHGAEASPGPYVVLHVNDTGTGIAPEVVDRMFEPFFTTKPLDMGTGLGLSNVLGIVKGHNGFISVSSQEGRGTTISMHLPADQRAKPLHPPAVPPPKFQGTGEQVLFVDDESGVRDVARRVLARLNYRPLLGENGVEGLAQALQHRDTLRLVITDLHMPAMDGLGLIRELVKALPRLPVMLVSGRLDPEIEAEVQAMGVRHFLHKPFTQTELSAAVHAALHQPSGGSEPDRAQGPSSPTVVNP